MTCFVPYRSYVKIAKLRLFLENLAHVKDNQYLSCLIWAEFFFFSFLDSFEINTIKAEIQHCAYNVKNGMGLTIFRPVYF